VDPLFEVVGVIADARNQGVQEPALPEAYVPSTLTGSLARGLVVRTSGRPDAIADVVSRAVWAVDRSVALPQAGTLTDFMRRFSYAGPQLVLMILGVFAGLGLVLVALGLAASLGLTRVLSSELLGVAPHDPATLAVVVAVVVTAGLAACYVPARRASRVDPMVALRYD
jgi:putative ABC transport system permease protein